MAPSRKTTGANGRGRKSGKPKKDTNVKESGAAAKKSHPSKGKNFPGRKKAHFDKAKAARLALGMSGPGPAGEFVERGPDGTFVNINGLPEKGCEGKKCRCNDVLLSSCPAHPSRKKVRTGRFTVPRTVNGTGQVGAEGPRRGGPRRDRRDRQVSREQDEREAPLGTHMCAGRGRPLPLSSKLRHLNRPTVSGDRVVPNSKPAIVYSRLLHTKNRKKVTRKLFVITRCGSEKTAAELTTQPPSVISVVRGLGRRRSRDALLAEVVLVGRTSEAEARRMEPVSAAALGVALEHLAVRLVSTT